MIRVKGVYRNASNIALKDLTFSVNSGQIVSFECNSATSNILIELLLKPDLCAKGEVFIDKTRLISTDEGLYDSMKVKEYLNFFGALVLEKNQVVKAAQQMALRDLMNRKIKALNGSERKRLQYARELLSPPKVLVIQEPLVNLDRESVTLVMEAILYFKSQGTAILTLNSSMRDALIMGDTVYRLDEDGIQPLKNGGTEDVGLEAQEDKLEGDSVVQTKVNKIQAKVEERLLLFDPIEIDYIEVDQGECKLSVRGEKFSSPHSMTELENKLVHMGFFRSHRSYLVNLQRVCEVMTWTRNSYSLGLDDKNKSVVPLSKGRLNALKEVLGLL